MVKDRQTALENKNVRLAIDRRGRIISLYNKTTTTELVTYPEAAEAWRLVVPTGRHTLAFVYGSQQSPQSIHVEQSGESRLLLIGYDKLIVNGRKEEISAEFTFELTDDSSEIHAKVKLDNRSDKPIDEVEFPVVGGMSGFKAGGKLELIKTDFWAGTFYGDVLNNGLPDTGRESDQYVREHETAMWEDAGRGALGLIFTDGLESLYAGYHSKSDFGFKLERFPKGVPNAPCHDYPQRTIRWLRLWGIHIAGLQPGKTWESGAVVLTLAKGTWHTAISQPAQQYMSKIEIAPYPKWLDNFVGWTEITGKLYTGEVFHDFDTCAKRVIADKKVTGLDLLFYYGHTNLGAEGADFDQSPARDMGGEKGFARMIKALHRNGVRIMLLDHFHRWINRDVPEYKKLHLEKYAMRSQAGKFYEARWWKETLLSCRRLEGPTPVWIEMCPACPEWQEFYLGHVQKMVERGVDALELDTFGIHNCWSRNHGHEEGANIFPIKLAFIKQAREMAQRMNPDFALFFESMNPCSMAAGDGWYSDRYTNEQGRIHRFLFPAIWRQTVRVGNYAYDAVNRSVQLGLGLNTEIWGLRKTTLAGCPELAEYIGRVTSFRRKYADLLIRGTFRDTFGARVDKDIFYSVLEGPNGTRALVLRNSSTDIVRVKPVFTPPKLKGRFVIWSPAKGERTVSHWPASITLPARGLVVILDL
jgi:hypothetical protein